MYPHQLNCIQLKITSFWDCNYHTVPLTLACEIGGYEHFSVVFCLIYIHVVCCDLESFNTGRRRLFLGVIYRIYP